MGSQLVCPACASQSPLKGGAEDSGPHFPCGAERGRGTPSPHTGPPPVPAPGGEEGKGLGICHCPGKSGPVNFQAHPARLISSCCPEEEGGKRERGARMCPCLRGKEGSESEEWEGEAQGLEGGLLGGVPRRFKAK